MKITEQLQKEINNSHPSVKALVEHQKEVIDRAFNIVADAITQ